MTAPKSKSKQILRSSSKQQFPNIRSGIDSGLHFGNVKYIPVKKGEVFRRLKSTEMLELIHIEEQTDVSENIHKLLPLTDENIKTIQIITHAQNSILPTPMPITSHSHSQSQSSLFQISSHNNKQHSLNHNHNGNGHGNNHDNYNSIINTDIDSKDNLHNDNNSSYENTSSYLLLDIRSEASYLKYHIQSAKLYNPALVRMDKLGHDIYAYKNKTDKIIVVCCDNELVGSKFATALVEKYIDNIFLLSTSVQRFCSKYPMFSEGDESPPQMNLICPKIVHCKLRPGAYKNKKRKKIKLKRRYSGSDADSVCSDMTSASGMSRMSTMSSMSSRTWVP